MMATVISPLEQRTLLRGISWETYNRLLADHLDKSSPHFTYDRGLLEIVSPSFEHEGITGLISLIVNVWAEELEIEVFDSRSTTFRREDLQRGFEADASFYIGSVSKISETTDIDLSNDPPPDLVVEIDITRSSLKKSPMFAEMGIPEVWRYTDKLSILRLESGTYVEVEMSPSLRGLTASAVTDFIKRDKPGKRLELLRRIRQAARDFKEGHEIKPAAPSRPSFFRPAY